MAFTVSAIPLWGANEVNAEDAKALVGLLAAVGNWVFEPAVEDGKPVARPYSTKVRLRWSQRSDSMADLRRPVVATGTLYSIRSY